MQDNKNIYKTNYILKTNLSFSLIIFILNIIAYNLSSSNKDKFVTLSIFVNCLVFFLYRLRMSKLTDKYWLALKKELMYINYPAAIGGIFLLILCVLAVCIICLGAINREALNSIFIFSFFMSIITMLLPSIIMVVYMFLINPAFILPSLQEKKRRKKSDIFILILFIIFLIITVSKFIAGTISSLNIDKRSRFKAIKLTATYPEQYLKYKNLLPSRIEILKSQKIIIPFFYTAENFKFNDYDEAEAFCKSMNAKVPNNLEIYNIIFNRFDTFGEQYYWTSDFAGKNNLILHFKNMSYEVMMKDNNPKITPLLYCISDINTTKSVSENNYFEKIKPETDENKEIFNNKKQLKFPPDIIKNELKEKDSVQSENEMTSIAQEARHVNFSVKIVPKEIFDKLTSEGYIYNPDSQANSYYESNNYNFERKVKEEGNIIRLCDFPFTDYKNMTKQNRFEIWKQSFCSPAFEVIKAIPEEKTKPEKDAYCWANGGRLPNIPELNAIIKTLKINNTNKRFWTNNQVTSSINYGKSPIAVYYDEYNFAIPEFLGNEDTAYTFCIKSAQKPSKIISNYKSVFYREEGKYYAKSICPACTYYEMPDTILNK